ncbi:FMN-binding negative transcriptional regulator [Nisaea nitritireducens]|uniref:FMN-binding negative transcriptional regulator n=1 Tax=Nisaea nitritireducens TaxID=568392 RepID=UPI0018673EFC|nr:FMN-binding negative transcriptional regulator [Nisaea nitritireducens]
MYTPPHFREDDIALLHETIRRIAFGTLVTLGPDGLVASHVPMLLDTSKGENGTLTGHLAKANIQTKTEASDIEALAIFQGPEAYITPNWYATKQEHGKVVPTWNYVAVHAYGKISFFEDAERLRDQVSSLTDRHEAANAEPWALNDAPEKFVQSQLKGIIGFEIPIARMDGKWKLSQNRPAADKEGVISGLDARDGADAAISSVTRERLQS